MRIVFARFIQAVGASAGSVVTQTIMRDVFSGQRRSQVFSIISGALALSPALGPFIGGYIEERQRDGAFREFEPKVAVRAFMGMMIHHSLNNILWDKQRNILDITNEEAAKNFAEILLKGIRV